MTRRVTRYALALSLVWGVAGWMMAYHAASWVSVAEAERRFLSDIAAFACVRRQDAIAVAEARDFDWSWIDNVATSARQEDMSQDGLRTGINVYLDRPLPTFGYRGTALYFNWRGCLVSPQPEDG